jgi:hypothetical protein
MTSENPGARQRPVPFLFHFARPMDETGDRILRYDPLRQLSQVLLDGDWVDGLDARCETAPETRLTKVHAETTDDE